MKGRLGGWEFIVAALAGTAAGLFVPNDFYGEGAGEIVTVLGFLIASFVPAMVLAATAIRPGGFSVQRIRALGAAVNRQIKLFGGLFLYALATCVVVIFGKLVEWTAPTVPANLPGFASFNLSFFFPALLTFLLVFLLLRSVAFLAGVLSILRLTTAVAEDEARARDSSEDRVAEADLDAYDMPQEYGSRLDVHS